VLWVLICFFGNGTFRFWEWDAQSWEAVGTVFTGIAIFWVAVEALIVQRNQQNLMESQTIIQDKLANIEEKRDAQQFDPSPTVSILEPEPLFVGLHVRQDVSASGQGLFWPIRIRNLGKVDILVLVIGLEANEVLIGKDKINRQPRFLDFLRRDSFEIYLLETKLDITRYRAYEKVQLPLEIPPQSSIDLGILIRRKSLEEWRRLLCIEQIDKAFDFSGTLDITIIYRNDSSVEGFKTTYLQSKYCYMGYLTGNSLEASAILNTLELP
jgi:hypothetical protein